jgi:hypothetical protein
VNSRGVVMICILSGAVHALAGQAPPQYQVQRLNGATFLEQVRTDVTSESGTAQQVRRVARTARFGVAMRGDTLVVTADSLDLRETADGVERTIDVDAVVGGRWILALGTNGVATVTTQPFVPGDVADVSDIAIAMNDFFPVTTMWRRLADSSGLSRYHWSTDHHSDSSYVTVDNVPVRATIDTKEEGDVVWGLTRGPVAWSRRVEVTATSHFVGRTSRAVITQRVTVRRTQ